MKKYICKRCCGNTKNRDKLCDMCKALEGNTFTPRKFQVTAE